MNSWSNQSKTSAPPLSGDYSDVGWIFHHTNQILSHQSPLTPSHCSQKLKVDFDNFRVNVITCRDKALTQYIRQGVI